MINNLEPAVFSGALGIASDGTNIYVAGHKNGVIGYWKNNTFVPQTDASYIQSIKIDGTNTYTAGISTTNLAASWKNGTDIDLTSSKSEAYDVELDNGDIYVAGSITDAVTMQPVAAYWKNGQPTTLPGGATASAITTLGNNVYACGGTGGPPGVVPKAVYWKNGVLQPFPKGLAGVGIVIVTQPH